MFEFEFHPTILKVLPVFTLGPLECENPACEAIHGMGLEIGWLVWTVFVGWEFAE